MVFDEAKYREVSDLVKTVKLDNSDNFPISFELFNINYNLLFCPSKDEDGHEDVVVAFYAARSKDWNDRKHKRSYNFDIYLWGDIGEKIQRPLLFHEIVETYHITKRMEATEAHNTTLPLEKRFCEDYLTSSEFEKYLKFKKRSWTKRI